MKNIRIMLSVLFCSTLLLAITANGAEVAKPDPGQPIPIQILGKTIEIRKGMTRSNAKAVLSSVIKDEASLDTASGCNTMSLSSLTVRRLPSASTLTRRA